MSKIAEVTLFLSAMVAILLCKPHNLIQLSPIDFHKALPILDEVDFNCLFARAVAGRHVTGRIYVDNGEDPKVFYIVHRYGMSLLIGDRTNTEFNAAFRAYALNQRKDRTDHEWMQVFPREWNTALKNVFGDALVPSGSNVPPGTAVVELNTRVNFRFSASAFSRTSRGRVEDPKVRIVESPMDLYEQMTGAVVPRNFWNSAEDFRDRAVSYTLYYDGQLAATAFSSFMHPGQLELAIETLPAFRKLGLGELVCARLIEHCLHAGLEPVWACRLENTGSYVLAQKLGFAPALDLPYYRLSN